MRRLTVLQLLPALASGGVERTTLEVAEALVRSGHRSLVVSAGGPLVATLTAAGSEHIRMDLGRKSLASLRHVVSLRRLFAQLRPDIVHARSRLPAWLAWLALQPGRRPGLHFVTSVHGLNSPGVYSGILTRGEQVICVSAAVREHVLRYWPSTDPRKLRIIEPGIDPLVFQWQGQVRASEPASGAGCAPDPRQKVLLMPGRGTRLKGHAAALELLAGLHAAGVAARLCLLGTREPGREAYVTELERLARQLGVADFVLIEPPRSDIARAYGQSDLVLQLSAKPEAFGRTVLEALSMGRPVVAWSHGGVADLLGRYFPEGQVPPGDQAALLATTLRVLAGSRRPARVFPQTLAAMQAMTMEVYESLAV